MNYIKINKLILLSAIVFFISSCTSASIEKFINLKDKDFYFQKFRYAKKGLNKNEAFEIMFNLKYIS
jgi:hypothetical protein